MSSTVRSEFVVITLTCPNGHTWTAESGGTSVCPRCGGDGASGSGTIRFTAPTDVGSSGFGESPTVLSTHETGCEITGSARELLDRALAAGVMKTGRAEEWTTLFPAEQRFVDADELGRELVARGRLTVHQFRVLRSGNDGEPLRVGDYLLHEPVGRGGMGTVYRAEDRRLGRIVALKLLAPRLLDDAGARERFEREGRAAARLEHDHIVTVHEIGVEAGRPFLAMRYVEGETLGGLLREGPLSGRRGAEYVSRVASAIEAAHRAGILHRDLKPENVLVDAETDRPLVTDFGIAKFSDLADSELTRTGEVIGTPGYMAPEQARDSGSVGPATDVYAIGATLYAVIVGRAPFVATSAVDTLRLMLDTDPLPPRQLVPTLDRDLETICLKCLEKDPRRRYGSAGEIERELNRYLAGEPIRARPLGRVGRAWRWCKRNAGLAAALGVAALAMIVAFVAVTIGYVTTAAARERAEAGYREARAAVGDFLTEVSEEELLDQPGLQPLRERLLRRALEYYERFLAERGGDPELRAEVAEVRYRTGLVREEIDGPDAALDDLREAARLQDALVAEAVTGTEEHTRRRIELAATLNALGRVRADRGELEEAIAVQERARKLRADLNAERPDDLVLARLHANTVMNLALVRRRAGGDVEATRDALREARTIRETWLEREPDHFALRRDLARGDFNLGNLELAAGRVDEARAAYEAAEEGFAWVVEHRPRDLRSRHSLVVATRLVGSLQADDTAARLAYRRALDVAEPLARENPEVRDFQLELARVQLNLGELETRDREFETARTLLVPAEATFEEFVREDEVAGPSAELRRDLAIAHRAAAVVDFFTGRHDDARRRLEAARTLLEELVEDRPEDEDLVTVLREVREMLAAVPVSNDE